MTEHAAPRPKMNYAQQAQANGSQSTALAMAMTAPMSLKNTMLDARDALMIVSYQLIIRVLFLARRWNY